MAAILAIQWKYAVQVEERIMAFVEGASASGMVAKVEEEAERDRFRVTMDSGAEFEWPTMLAPMDGAEQFPDCMVGKYMEKDKGSIVVYCDGVQILGGESYAVATKAWRSVTSMLVWMGVLQAGWVLWGGIGCAKLVAGRWRRSCPRSNRSESEL
jgi:hypothetical protein